MKKELFYKALEQIPGVVAKIAAWNNIQTKLYSEVVECYTQSGTMFSKDVFTIDEDEFLDHVERAKKQWDCSIETVSDEKVVIKRTKRNGEYYIATYRPTVSSGVLTPA